MSTILVPIGILIYLKLNKFYQFTLLSLAALLPLSFGDFRSIPSFQFIEWLPIVTFLMLMNELIPLNGSRKGNIEIKLKGLGIFIFAIIILIIWTINSFVENEILIQTANVIQKSGTTRIYFSVFNNILLFFTTIIFVSLHFEQIDFEKFFKILLYLSLSLGLLRIMSHFLDFNIPLLSGAFDYGGEYGKYSKLKYGGTAFRLGGLSEVVIIGIPAIFSDYVFRKKINVFVLLLLLLFLFLSGGRTVMIGVFFSIIIFSFLFFPKNFVNLILGGGLFLIVAAIILPESLLQGQTGRLTTVNSENLMGFDPGRALAWKFYFETFLSNPIWGKGIASYTGFIYASLPKFEGFARHLLFSGGHGSYISLLSILGLGGIAYFLIMLIGGIILSYFRINQNLDANKTAVAVFIFMILIIKAFDFFTANNGLDIPILFYCVGFIASLTVLQNMDK